MLKQIARQSASTNNGSWLCKPILWTLCLCLVAPASPAQQRPAAEPGELVAGPRLAIPDLSLSPDGRWLAMVSDAGPGFFDLTTGKISAAGNAVKGEYWL